MKKIDLIKHFGSVSAAAAALGVTVGAISKSDNDLPYSMIGRLAELRPDDFLVLSGIKKKKTFSDSVSLAISAVGSVDSVANALGVSSSSVQKWAATGRVPSQHATRLAKLSGFDAMSLINGK